MWERIRPERCTVFDLFVSRDVPVTEDHLKMRFRTHCLIASVGMLLAGSAFAQGTGRSLDIQPGGRQNGMGAAGVALPEDVTGATWWNPAALGFIEKPGVQLTYAKLVPG